MTSPAADITIGVDVGQAIDPTAILIAEVQAGDSGGAAAVGYSAGIIPDADPAKWAPHRMGRPPMASAALVVETEVYVTRHLERLALGTSYDGIGLRLRDIVTELRRKAPAAVPRVYVDFTGVGRPVLEIIANRLQGVAHVLIPVTILSGDGWHEGAVHDGRSRDDMGRPRGAPQLRGLRVGKGHLVSRLNVLLQSRRFLLPNRPPSLVSEVEEMRRQLKAFETRAKVTHDQYGARSGEHDDYVIAAALAALEGGMGGSGPSLADVNEEVGRGARDLFAGI